jgi:hypothetical protein
VRATKEALEKIAWIENEVTQWFAGREVSVYDLVDTAVSLTGLVLTVDMEHNRACIQEF